MRLSMFERLVRNKVGNETMNQYEFLKKFNNKIFNESEWKLFKPEWSHKLEDGVYQTIRVGYSGIYTMVNIWNTKTKDWETKVADGSYTIMYKDLTKGDFE